MTCLKELSTVWRWSLRAIQSIQILAKQWGIKEQIDSHDAADALRKTDIFDGSRTTNDSTFPEFPPAMGVRNDLGDANWLFDFGSPTLFPPFELMACDDPVLDSGAGGQT
jgi:hypothetical protein